MNEEQIKYLIQLHKQGRKIFWQEDNNVFLKVVSITNRKDEDDQPCANLENGTYCLLEHSEPQDFYLMERVFFP